MNKSIARKFAKLYHRIVKNKKVNSTKKILLIDGNSFLYRSYYGSLSLLGRPGVSTNGVYTAIRMLRNFLTNFSHYQKIYVFFDLGKETVRHKEYPNYKITRKKTPSELIEQISLFKDFLQSIGVDFLENKNYEADDLIGSAADLILQKEITVDILSNDRDLLQLIQPGVSQIFCKKGVSEIEKIDINNFSIKFLVKPNQVPDLKGLAGDKSDNILGVRGIGDKTAEKLLKDFDKIENIYQNLGKLPVKLQKLLSKNRKSAFQSKRLATIIRNIPLQLNFTKTEYNFDNPQAKDFYLKHRMFSLLKKNKTDFKKNKTESENQQKHFSF